jgi:6-phosphofructokinase 2
VPAEFYARVAATVRELGSRLVLDTSAAALARATDAGVYLLKPSLHEFRTLMGEPEVDEAQLASLGSTVVKRGWCEILVLSLGAGGALWVTASESERLAAPAVPIKSSVGAGDSMVAGIVLALSRDEPSTPAARGALLEPGATPPRLWLSRHHRGRPRPGGVLLGVQPHADGPGPARGADPAGGA